MVNGRRKGHQFERDVAIALKGIFPNAKRKLEYQIQDCVGVDLENTGEFLIQCKRGRKYSPLSAIEEILPVGIKVLITEGDRKKPIAALYLDDFLKLLEAYEEKKQATSKDV